MFTKDKTWNISGSLCLVLNREIHQKVLIYFYLQFKSEFKEDYLASTSLNPHLFIGFSFKTEIVLPCREKPIFSQLGLPVQFLNKEMFQLEVTCEKVTYFNMSLIDSWQFPLHFLKGKTPAPRLILESESPTSITMWWHHPPTEDIITGWRIQHIKDGGKKRELDINGHLKKYILEGKVLFHRLTVAIILTRFRFCTYQIEDSKKQNKKYILEGRLCSI